MNLWTWGLMGASWCLLVSVAFAQTPATTTGPTSASPRFDHRPIREMQRRLEALGLDPGPADGVLGPRTKAALTRFQQAERLSPTGRLDIQTRAKLAARKREHVLKLQTALKATGVDPGPADGVMGNRTKAALRRYATAPAPSPATASSQLIDRFWRAYEPSLQQSP